MMLKAPFFHQLIDRIIRHKDNCPCFLIVLPTVLSLKESKQELNYQPVSIVSNSWSAYQVAEVVLSVIREHLVRGFRFFFSQY